MAFGKLPPKSPKNLSATKGNTMGTSKSKNPFLKGNKTGPVKTGPNPAVMPGPTTKSPMGKAPNPFGKKGF